MDNCIFCKIVKGNIPSYKVWEDDNFLAFLDIIPIKPGHTLLIPKKHQDYVFDLTDHDLGEIFKASGKVAEILKKVYKPKSGKVGVVIYGLDINHVHIHLVPIDKTGDLDFNKKKPAAPEKLEFEIKKIQAALS